jgi:hypothetical protein
MVYAVTDELMQFAAPAELKEVEMKSFSSGLLYSTPPEYLSQLHIDDEDQTDNSKKSVFSWQYADDSIAMSMSRLLEQAARKLGFANPEK